MTWWKFWQRPYDIGPDTQEKLRKLRELIRTCQHKGKRRRNSSGVLFCADCCRHLNEDGTEA